MYMQCLIHKGFLRLWRRKIRRIQENYITGLIMIRRIQRNYITGLIMIRNKKGRVGVSKQMSKK